MRAVNFKAKRMDAQLLEAYRSQSGDTIHTLSEHQPLLLVFLRHFG